LSTVTVLRDRDSRLRFATHLLDAAAHGLRNVAGIHLQEPPRMADFALWTTASETVFRPAGTFTQAYQANRSAAIEESTPIRWPLGCGRSWRTARHGQEVLRTFCAKERQGRTMSELVETALRLRLHSQRKPGRIPALPVFRSGGTVVDIADRDALYQAMECR
jgi:hypothetical protein